MNIFKKNRNEKKKADRRKFHCLLFYMPGLLFPQQNLFNAAYEQVVIILLRIHVFIDGFVKEAAWVNLLTGHLFADKNQPRLLIVRGGLVKANGQAGFFVLVHIFARVGAAICQCGVIRFVEEAEGIIVLLLQKLHGIPLRTDENVRNILFPQNAQSAPTGCQGVVSGFVAGSDQHPFLADEGEGIKGEICGGYGFPNWFLHTKFLLVDPNRIGSFFILYAFPRNCKQMFL